MAAVKNLPSNSGDTGSIPERGRSPGGGSSNPLQHSCLENPMDKGAWQATVHGVAQSDTIDQLSTPPKILISGNANDSLFRGFYSWQSMLFAYIISMMLISTLSVKHNYNYYHFVRKSLQTESSCVSPSNVKKKKKSMVSKAVKRRLLACVILASYERKIKRNWNQICGCLA